MGINIGKNLGVEPKIRCRLLFKPLIIKAKVFTGF